MLFSAFDIVRMLSLIGLGWIGAFESMIWLCFEAPHMPQKKDVSSPKLKKQKRLHFIRKTVITRRMHKDDPLCGESCTICLHDFHRSDTVCFSPNSKCTHGFHIGCAEEWLSQHVRCPCCRENFLQKAGKKNLVPEADPGAPCLKQGWVSWMAIRFVDTQTDSADQKHDQILTQIHKTTLKGNTFKYIHTFESQWLDETRQCCTRWRNEPFLMSMKRVGLFRCKKHNKFSLKKRNNFWWWTT